MMKAFLAVSIGSGLGGMMRFGLGRWVESWQQQVFPYGTFMVNLLACVISGFVIGLADQKQILSPAARQFLTVGFCGGFSTFSAFSAETLQLFQNGQVLLAVMYAVLSIVLGVGAIFAGMWLLGRI